MKLVASLELDAGLIEKWVQEQTNRLSLTIPIYGAPQPTHAYDHQVTWDWNPDTRKPHATVRVLQLPAGPHPDAVLGAQIGQLIKDGFPSESN